MNLYSSVFIFFISFTSFDLGSAAPDKEQVNTVPNVNIERYLGVWYEIASIPQRFQKHCVANTTAKYVADEKNVVQVQNSCLTADGSRSFAEGRARVIDPSNNAKLQVTFVNFFGWWIYLFGGDYWIIDLHQEYEYAVVGHPKRTYGWILSREPNLSLEHLRMISTNLRNQRYDTCAFNMTRQDGGYARGPMRFCDFLNF